MRQKLLLAWTMLCCAVGSVLAQNAPPPADYPPNEIVQAGGCGPGGCGHSGGQFFGGFGGCTTGNCGSGNCGSGNCGSGCCNTGCDPCGAVGVQFLAEVDYLLYWLKPVCLKPETLSTGSFNDAQPGVPGQPNTNIVQGGHKFEFKGANGIRARVGAWAGSDEAFGIEAEGFILEQVSAGQPVTTVNGSPATFIVFKDPNNANAALPLTIPGIVTGDSIAVGMTQLWGVEANLAYRLASGCSLCRATLLLGCRYLHLDDRVVVSNRQGLVGDPTARAVGLADFATYNQFIGAQVGSRFAFGTGPIVAELTTKLALGESLLASKVSGGPLVAGQSVAPALVPGPFLALPSNVGRQSSERIAVVPEVNLRVRWAIVDNVQLTLGYNLLYWNKVLCPGDQMDPRVNTTQLPFRGPATGPAVPAPLFVFTDAFAHGLEAGLAFSF